jgi:hypothetical protein
MENATMEIRDDLGTRTLRLAAPVISCAAHNIDSLEQNNPRSQRASVTTLSFHLREALLVRGDFLSAFPMALLSRFSSVKALPVGT